MGGWRFHAPPNKIPLQHGVFTRIQRFSLMRCCFYGRLPELVSSHFREFLYVQVSFAARVLLLFSRLVSWCCFLLVRLGILRQRSDMTWLLRGGNPLPSLASIWNATRGCSQWGRLIDPSRDTMKDPHKAAKHHVEPIESHHAASETAFWQKDFKTKPKWNSTSTTNTSWNNMFCQKISPKLNILL